MMVATQNFKDQDILHLETLEIKQLKIGKHI